MNPFTIRNHQGAPTLFKNGKPVFPLLFWQSEVLDRDAHAFYDAGVEIFSCFRSQHKYASYWTGEGEYEFSGLDHYLREFHKQVPDAYCIPRISVRAPEWWLEKNPEEVCGYAVDAPRSGIEGPWQGTFHESFASEKWKKEMGEAFRMLIRHMKESDYADCIVGIHIADGITGEWHLWSPQLRPDTSVPMRKRYGKPIPPPEERGADYYRCLNEATADAIEHFAAIVKEESDFLTAVFYGYTPDLSGPSWNIEGDHRAAALVHRMPDVDMISAPHSYHRRKTGQDGYFRNFPSSVALHGKLFVDEGDDRTYLDGIEGNGYPRVGCVVPETLEESLNIVRREFGNMLTYNVGMWYMDLNGGNFHDDRIMEEIAKLKRWGDYSLQLPRTRHAEVAVIASPESEFYLPKRGQPGNNYADRYRSQMGELCKAGAPFDFYLSADLESEVMERYKVIFCLDALALNTKERKRLHELQKGGRTFLWFHDSGAIVDGMRSLVHSRELTGLEMEETAPASPVKKVFPQWTSIDLGEPSIPAATLRELFREAGVHIYLESEDVFSASNSALMIHAASDGEKKVLLPRTRRITNIVTGEKLGEAQSFALPMKFGETALFLLEEPEKP